MATITKQTIRVDLTPGRVYPVLHVSQGDVGLEALEFYIYQNGQPFTIPSGVTAVNIDGMTPVGVFSYPCTWTGNVVTAGLTATMTAERGIDICELALYDATNNKIGTCNFIIAVEESPFTNAHVSTSDMATIMAAATEVQQNTLLSKSWAVGDTGIRTGENTNNSEYWAEISESWAVGGTGKRTGEDTNNSEYWSGVAHQYANTVSFKTYDTVAQMKADTGLLDGGVCRTLGYYAVNDGGGALYKIVSAVPTTHYETLANGLFAQLNQGKSVTLEQYGYDPSGNGYADAYVQEIYSDGVKVISLLEAEYKFQNSLVMALDSAILGKSKRTSILTFADSVDGVEMRGRNTVSDIGINISGDASALYVYSPHTAYYNLNSEAENIFINYVSGSAGVAIDLVAENTGVTNEHEGFYNAIFRNIRTLGTMAYGIRLHNKVKTTGTAETWITEAIFEDIFFDAVGVAFDSDWEDISGTNAVPHTGASSMNGSITLRNVAAEYSTATECYANIQNSHCVHFIDCHPFDYFHLLTDGNKPLFKLNAYGSMCSVDLGYQMEANDKNGFMYRYFEIANGSGDFNKDFKKCVLFVVYDPTKRVYGDFITLAESYTNDDVFTIQLSGATSILRQARVCGDMATVTLELNHVSLVAGSNTLGKLKYGFRPNGIAVHSMCFLGSSAATGTPVRLAVISDGTVYAFADAAIGPSALRMTFTYIRTQAI